MIQIATLIVRAFFALALLAALASAATTSTPAAQVAGDHYILQHA